MHFQNYFCQKNPKFVKIKFESQVPLGLVPKLDKWYFRGEYPNFKRKKKTMGPWTSCPAAATIVGDVRVRVLNFRASGGHITYNCRVCRATRSRFHCFFLLKFGYSPLKYHLSSFLTNPSRTWLSNLILTNFGFFGGQKLFWKCIVVSQNRIVHQF